MILVAMMSMLLDEDEQKAIDDLLKDVAKVSDQFFSGNVQQAFKKG